MYRAQATLLEMRAHHHGLVFKDTLMQKDKPQTCLQIYTETDSQEQLARASMLVMHGDLDFSWVFAEGLGLGQVP